VKQIRFVRKHIRNPLKSQIGLKKMSLHLEPWGDEFLLQPMECIKVAIIGSERKAIPVTYTGDSIIIDAWAGTTSEVWKGDQRLN